MIYIFTGFFIGTTIYLWFINWCLVKERDFLTDTLYKSVEELVKVNEKIKEMK